MCLDVLCLVVGAGLLLTGKLVSKWQVEVLGLACPYIAWLAKDLGWAGGTASGGHCVSSLGQEFVYAVGAY